MDGGREDKIYVTDALAHLSARASQWTVRTRLVSSHISFVLDILSLYLTKLSYALVTSQKRATAPTTPCFQPVLYSPAPGTLRESRRWLKLPSSAPTCTRGLPSHAASPRTQPVQFGREGEGKRKRPLASRMVGPLPFARGNGQVRHSVARRPPSHPHTCISRSCPSANA